LNHPSLFGDDEALDKELRRSVKKRSQRRADAFEEARTFGGWTVDKLDLIKLYHRLYLQVAGGGTYVDGFAGSGRARIKGEVMERPGSVELAIADGSFSRLLVFEKSPRVVAQLRSNLSQKFGPKTLKKVWIRQGDFNKEVLSDLDAGNIPKDKPCFALLDPDSTQLDWSTIEALASYKGGDPPRDCRPELLILFNTDQALVRLIPREQDLEYADSAMARTLDRVMGGRKAWEDLNGPQLTAVDLMNRYRHNLQGLGYAYTTAVPILSIAGMKPRRQYFMVQASEHPKARDLMLWAETAMYRARGVEALLPTEMFADREMRPTPPVPMVDEDDAPELD